MLRSGIKKSVRARRTGNRSLDPQVDTPNGASEIPIWLLGIADVPSRRADERALGDACAFALTCWQILPCVWRRLVAWAGVGVTNSVVTQSVRDRLASVHTLARTQRLLLERYVTELDRRHVPYVLLKGSAVCAMAYEYMTDRCGIDIDVGVSKKWIRDAEKIALDQGFVQAEFDAQNKRFFLGTFRHRAAVEKQHYELGFLVREQVIVDLDERTKAAIRRDLTHQDPWHETDEHDLACYVTLDLHHGLSMTCTVDEAVASSSELIRNGLRLRVPSVPWVVFQLIEKLYLEGVAVYRKGGYQYADLVRLVAKIETPDALALIELLSKHALGVPAFYVLRRLPTEFGVELPAPVKQFIAGFGQTPERGQDAYKLNDLGDMWPKLWGYR